MAGGLLLIPWASVVFALHMVHGVDELRGYGIRGTAPSHPSGLPALVRVPYVRPNAYDWRVRLLRLIALPQGGDAPVYRSVPPSRDEFSADEEPLAWDADGWEAVGGAG